MKELEKLNAREHDILEMMADGRANKWIADELGLGEETIKTYARNIFRKLHANSRVHAVAIALRNNIIE